MLVKHNLSFLGQLSYFIEKYYFVGFSFPLKCKHTFDMGFFQNEMNDKFKNLPLTPDDFAKFVTRAELEDVLQGTRKDQENLQQPTERVVIEMSSQIDPVVSHILYQ